MFEEILNISTGWKKTTYNWRDVALYALAVGAERDEIQYYYEKHKDGMKILPSFASIPYYSAINSEPELPFPYPAHYAAADRMSRELGYEVNKGFHMGFEMNMEHKMEAIRGTLLSNSYVEHLYDRGAGKGTDLEIRNVVYDEAGNLICTNKSFHRFPNVGGWGGPEPVKKEVFYPDREPDYIKDSYISPIQNALYRLTGDTNEVHINPDVALENDSRGVFMQGLSSMGYACRMLIQGLIPGKPEKMKRIYVQMRAKAYPDTHVRLLVWKTAKNKAVFRYVDTEHHTNILDHCEFEWEG